MLPQGVSPLGSVWVYNLLSVLPAERSNYCSNVAELGARCLNSTDISLHRHNSSLVKGEKKTKKKHWCCDCCRRERNPPRLPLTTPVLTSTIDMLLSWAIELASLWISIRMSRCSCLGQGQPMNHIQTTMNNVQTRRYGNKSCVAESR